MADGLLVCPVCADHIAPIQFGEHVDGHTDAEFRKLSPDQAAELAAMLGALIAESENGTP